MMAAQKNRTIGKLLIKPIEPECLKHCEHFLRELTLREYSEAISARLKKENKFYRNAIKSILSEIKELTKPNHAAMNFIRMELQDEPEILNAYYFVRDDVINIWAIIKKENLDIEGKVAEALGKMFSIFQNLKFDFMIIPIQHLKLNDFLPSDSKRIF